MRSASADAADGFDQAFGLRSPTVAATGEVAVKQGWMCCVRHSRYLHSTGVLPDGTLVMPGSADTLAQLQQLADLKERGVLTDEEFAVEKAKVLHA